jgi:AraC-like DNA-binding protein
MLERSGEIVVITFRTEFLPGDSLDSLPWNRLFLDHSPKNRNLLLSPDESAAAIRTAMELVAEYSADRPFRLDAMRLLLKSLLLPLARQSHSVRPGASQTDMERIRRVMDLVTAKLPQAIPVEDACSAAGLSRSQFALVFHRVTGVTFADFVRRTRLARVARDLIATDTKIAAVAQQWGFTDQSHLHRLFRKYFHCTPGEYRRRKPKTNILKSRAM